MEKNWISTHVEYQLSKEVKRARNEGEASLMCLTVHGSGNEMGCKADKVGLLIIERKKYIKIAADSFRS